MPGGAIDHFNGESGIDAQKSKIFGMPETNTVSVHFWFLVLFFVWFFTASSTHIFHINRCKQKGENRSLWPWLLAVSQGK
jgi:hypothetical protein